MPKKDSMAAMTLLPAQAQQEAKKMIPAEAVKGLPFFKKLSNDEQSQLLDETRQLGTAMMVHGTSALSIGKHLADINEILTKQNAFYKYLKFFGIAPKTAYRYMNGYTNAVGLLPDNVVKAAMTRGLSIVGHDEKRPLGNYTQAVKALPPPRNPDPERAAKYVDDIVGWMQKRKSYITKSRGKLKPANIKGEVEPEIELGDPDLLKKAAYRALTHYYKRLPGRAPKKAEWLKELFGMLLTDIGVSSWTVQAAAVPEDFPAKRGRPVLLKEETEAAPASASA